DWHTDARIKRLRAGEAECYSSAVNVAASSVSGDYIVLLDGAVEVVAPEWLSELVSVGSQSGVGAVGGSLSYGDGTLMYGGIVLGIHGFIGHAHRGLKSGAGYGGRAALISEFSAVTGACLLVN